MAENNPTHRQLEWKRVADCPEAQKRFTELADEWGGHDAGWENRDYYLFPVNSIPYPTDGVKSWPGDHAPGHVAKLLGLSANDACEIVDVSVYLGDEQVYCMAIPKTVLERAEVPSFFQLPGHDGQA